MPFESEKRVFDRDGFVVVRNFLSADDFKELNAQLSRYIGDVVPTLASSFAFYTDAGRPETLKQLQHMAVDRFFNEYRHHPRWRELAEALVGERALADEPEWFNKPAGTDTETPPHQDNYYFCLRPPNVVTIWLALDRVDEGNGCLRYQAGSHELGVRPHRVTKVLGFSQGIEDYSDAERQREVAVVLNPGDAVAHHGNAIHRADGNRSHDRQRRAFAMVWRGVSCQRDDEAFERYQAAFTRQYAEMTAR